MCVDEGMQKCEGRYVTFGFVDTQNIMGIVIMGKDWGDVKNRPRYQSQMTLQSIWL